MLKIFEDIGLTTLINAPKDIKLMYCCKIMRNTSYSGSTLIIALFLKEIGFEPGHIGVFIGIGGLGDLIKTFYLSLIVDQFGRRRLMRWCYSIMLLSNLIFACCETKAILWAVGFAGIISVSGLEVSIFRACEQSGISEMSTPKAKSDYFSWYAFLAVLCKAIGSVTYGWFLWALQKKFNYTTLQSYKICFLTISIFCACAFLITTKISSDVEFHKEDDEQATEGSSAEEQSSLIHETEEQIEETYGSVDMKSKSSSTASISVASVESQETGPFTKVKTNTGYGKVAQIVALYSIDTMCMSMTMDSWIAYYMVDRFHADTKTVGTVFLIINSVNASMALVGTIFCKKYGPIYTMLGGHVIGTFFTFLVPFAPDIYTLCMCLFFRNLVKSMDQGSKTVYITLSVDKNKQSAALGLQNTFSKLSNSVAPVVTGFLTNGGRQWASFILAGLIRACVYEMGILTLFWKDRHLIPK